MNWKNYLNESSNKPNIPFFIGPTASGKSSAAFALAKEENGEIISADSMQIYKEMDIGTAKPTKKEQKEVKHHLIDIISPDGEYSVSHFVHDANILIEDILSRGKLPIICGGTGLYINALTQSYNLDEKNTDEKIRKQLEETAKEEDGKKRLYDYLLRVDPISAEKIHPNNIKRVIRALEIFEVTGTPKSQLDQRQELNTLFYNPVLLSPNVEREELYRKINSRVDIMMDQGLLDEVKYLENKYPRNLKSMQAIGYKEFFPYIDKKISLDEAIDTLKKETRHYAKRQLTWYRKNDNIIYF